jgi:pyrimidine-nucleoside phosphorylase
MRMYDIIEKKRDGYELTHEELNFFIKGFCSGDIPDYQASAFLMAIYLRGMNSRETSDLTMLMAGSGDRIDLSQIDGIKVDKHSTGGVGDKTTLVLAPIVAACGIPVAKMSGRGLGHTGGTIDKLESIKGLHTSLSSQEFIENVRQIGIAIAGQTGNLAPADKKLYALRDVTATVSNVSLIASSIMSKKIAAGADRIVLDVKTGSGAFMKTLDDSIKLAKEMVMIGEHVGRKTIALVTDMDIPLGNAIGNALEVKEAIDTLKGRGPSDLTYVSGELAARMLELAEKGNIETCRLLVEEKIKDGSAFDKFIEMITKQGGSFSVDGADWIDDKANYTTEVLSPSDGYITSIKTDSLGATSMILGAGRETKESIIDYAAGIMLYRKPGTKVSKGELLAHLYTNKKDKIEEAGKVFLNSISFSDQPTAKRPLILAFVSAEDIKMF